jgi:oxygen-independent coproporphyrinogen-3 oxidase
MTSLRTMWGMDLNKLNQIAPGASDELSKPAEEFFNKDWIRQENKIIYLTQTGKLYADHIAAQLFF